MKQTTALISLMLMLLATTAKGQDNETYRHHASFTGALSSCNIWQLEFSYHYMPCAYVGIGGAIGTWKQYEHDGVPSGTHWQIDSEDKRLSDFYLRPSVLLFSPAFVKTKKISMGLTAEPGLQLKIPYERVGIERFDDPVSGIPTRYTHTSSSHGDWYAFTLKAGLYLLTDQLEFSAGYLFSTQDIYSARRHMRYDNISFSEFYPESQNIGGAYLSISYRF